MRDVLNAAQTAKVLGCAASKVRARIRIGEWPGKVIPKKKTGKKSDAFEIKLHDLEEYFHIPQEEIHRRLEA